MASKNNRKRNNRTTQDAILRPPKEELQVEVVPNRKIETERNAKRKILIIGEGATEAAYFLGLKATFPIIEELFDIDTLPAKDEDESENENGRSDYSAAKALLYTAMKKQKDVRIKYEQVWIVSDNDEQNAYKLDDNSLRRIRTAISENTYLRIAELQVQQMDVRIDLPEDKQTKKRYFLTETEYRQFLSDEIQGISTEEMNAVIQLTTKKHALEWLFNEDLRAFFFKNGVFKEEKNFEKAYFDEKCFKYLKIAYTSIAFEHWLLLHFERCLRPFYNSEEVIKYFDDQKYFIKEEKKYKKGWYLYENRDEPHLKAFFQAAETAIKNNLWLNATQRHSSQQEIYEYNPYSTVFELALFLFGENIPTVAIFGETILLKDYEITATRIRLQLFFTVKNKQQKSELRNYIYDFFSAEDLNGQNVLSQVQSSANNIILPDEEINVTLNLAQGSFTYPLFVYFKTRKGKIVWVIE